MFVALLILLILGSWRLAKVPGRYTAAMVLGVWLAVLGVLAFAPDSSLARLIGGSVESWAVIGGIAFVIFGYFFLLRGLKSRVMAVGHGGTDGLPPEPVSTEPAPAEPAAAEITPEDDQLDRYARHIVLREIGGPGQGKLNRAKVLIIGAGALGSPVALYLAAAGVGRITIADDDHVSVSNLQRQILYRSADAGIAKTKAAAATLAALNPHVEVTALDRRIGAGDAAMLAEFDLVLDGTDTFAARQAINAACVAAAVPLIAGAIAQWEGQVTVWDPAHGAPCMACLFPEAPADGLAPSCAEAGVVGALPGVIGSMMALEAIKLITGAGAVLRGEMVIFDGLWGETRRIRVKRRPDCAVCGGAPSA